MEKGQRFSKLLTSAKTQIEKLRKDNEVGTEVSEKKHKEVNFSILFYAIVLLETVSKFLWKSGLNFSSVNVSWRCVVQEGQKEREKLHEDIKAEVDMRVDLQNKVWC